MAEQTFVVGEEVHWTAVTGKGSTFLGMNRKDGVIVSVGRETAVVKRKNKTVTVALVQLRKMDQPSLLTQAIEALRKRE